MSLRFALNHMVAPRLDLGELFQLARSLEISEVEIRNDVAERPMRDGTSAAAVRAAAAETGVTIVSINALQRFDAWSAAREREAVELARYASAAGARGLVLVPTNDRTPGTERALDRALHALGPILADQDIVGLVEPLGFSTSSLRSKRQAVEAIESAGGRGRFGLVHDTFHHTLAGEPELYPEMTSLAHLSGVSDRAVPMSDLEDRHRGLVDSGDRLDTARQVGALLAGGYTGPLSFEPFAAEVHGLRDVGVAIRRSMEYIETRAMGAAI